MQTVTQTKPILASAARTTTTVGSALPNPQHRGVLVVLDVTVVPGSAPSLTMKVETLDTTSGKYIQLHANATAVTATGTTCILVYPGLSQTEEGGITLAANAHLGKTWRVTVTAGNANSATYSVGATLLP